MELDDEIPDSIEKFTLVCISDTHNRTDSLIIPPGDVLVHAGDFTFDGSYKQVRHFTRFFDAQPHPIKILIAGNHDSSFDTENYTEIQAHYKKKLENPHKIQSLISKYIYLNDSGTNIYGYNIWGTPWIRKHHKGAFSIEDKGVLESKRNLIPENVDILISHCPPKGILDKDNRGLEQGCEFMMNAVTRIRPRYHIFGHIHPGYGVMSWNDTLFINASICDNWFRPVNLPVVIDLPILRRN